MKITLVEVKDYKRVNHIRVAPEADRVLVLVGGKNGQGKTSLLDAITTAIGGKKAQAADPVRHGAERAEIRVEFDGGDLVATRVIEPDGTSKLELRDADGALKSPQERLNKLISQRFLDPLEFLKLDGKGQRQALLDLVDKEGRIEKLDEKRERLTAKRTELSRDLKKAEGELLRLPQVKPGTPIDVAALAAEARAIEERLRAAGETASRVTAAANARDQAAARLDALRLQVEQAEAELASRDKVLAAATAAHAPLSAADAERRDAIGGELARAQAHNAAVAGDVARAERRVEVADEVAKLRAEHNEADGYIAKIDERKLEVLAGSPLPVPGLGVSDAGVTLDGVPLEQASAAERVRVSLGLAIAAAPTLRDVFVRDGALLDEDSLSLVQAAAAAAGVRVWVERVGDRDPGAIVIHDGKVVAAAGKAA